MQNEKKDLGSNPQPGKAEAEIMRVTPRLEPMPAERSARPESVIGDRISFARKELKLSVEALARYTSFVDPQEQKGISASVLLRYEKGDHEPGAREIRILCDALDVPPKWLIYGALDNAGEDVLEQQLMRALGEYVAGRANEMRPESGTALRRTFSDRPTAQQRRDWLEKAKSGSRAK